MPKKRLTKHVQQSNEKKERPRAISKKGIGLFKYEAQKMLSAVEAVKNGMSFKKAAELHGVPRSTLTEKVRGHGKPPDIQKVGAHSVLTLAEEAQLEKWLYHLADTGFPVTKDQLLDSVANLMTALRRKNPFKNNRPGNKWFKLFRNRHPDVSSRIAQILTKSRASITEESLRDWYKEIGDYLKENNLSAVLKNPSRIFNLDEAAFFLAPAKDKVLVHRSTRSAYTFSSNNERECTTVLLGGNAAGNLVPPMVIFKLKRLTNLDYDSIPNHWGFGRSDSGWMTSQTFYEYITKVFHPYLLSSNTELPAILFVDGHVSHITYETSEFCKKNQIVLVALYPNATHIMQPMDVGVFHPLKACWRKHVKDYVTESEGKKLNRVTFCVLLDKVISKAITPGLLTSAFEACGLYPFDANRLDYQRLIRNKKMSSGIPSPPDSSTSSCSCATSPINNHLEFIEKEIGTEKMLQFYKNIDDEWQVNTEDKSLFILWKSLKMQADDEKKRSRSDVEAPAAVSAVDLEETNEWIDANLPAQNTIDWDDLQIHLNDNLIANYEETYTHDATIEDVHIELLDLRKRVDDDIDAVRNELEYETTHDEAIPSQISHIPTSPEADTSAIIQKNLHWPQMKMNNPKKTQNPFVLTGKEGLDVQLQKKVKKQDIENKKVLSALKKAHKKQNEKKSPKKQPLIKENMSSEHDSAYQAEDASSSEKPDIPSASSFVIIKRECEYFPCRVLEENDDNLHTERMVPTGGVNYKFPEVPIQEWYKCSEVIRESLPQLELVKEAFIAYQKWMN